MLYEGDKTENLMDNGKDVLQKMTCNLPDKLYKVLFLSGDHNFPMAPLNDNLNATSNGRWTINHKSHKDSRCDVHSSGHRTDLNLPVDSIFPNAVIPGVPTSSYVICIMHGFVRQTEKLLDLEIENMFSNRNKAEQLGLNKTAFIEETIAALENNINRHRVRHGNFEIHYDNAGLPKPVKLNGTHADVITSPVPAEFPHPFHKVLCNRRKILLIIPADIIGGLQLEKEMA